MRSSQIAGIAEAQRVARAVIDDVARERPHGVFAIEPHLARRDCGTKFESILVVDGDETR